MIITNEAIPFLIRSLFFVHVVCAALALSVFLIPLLTKKGGRIHVKVGLIYVISMFVVCLTAIPITLWRILLDPEKSEHSQSSAGFIFFIAVLSFTSICFGLRTLKEKTRSRPDFKIINIGLPLLLLATALTTVVAGVQLHHLLLTYFPLVGVFAAINQLKYWMSTPPLKMHWWYAHMSGMIMACIAMLTAFVVAILPKLFVFQDLKNSVLLWAAPSLILIPVLEIWTRYYKKQFGE